MNQQNTMIALEMPLQPKNVTGGYNRLHSIGRDIKWK